MFGFKTTLSDASSYQQRKKKLVLKLCFNIYFECSFTYFNRIRILNTVSLIYSNTYSEYEINVYIARLHISITLKAVRIKIQEPFVLINIQIVFLSFFVIYRSYNMHVVYTIIVVNNYKMYEISVSIAYVKFRIRRVLMDLKCV